MITNEVLNKLYSIEFEWGLTFSTNDLYRVGLTNSEINYIVNSNYIVRMKKAIYRYDLYKLLEYSTYCMSNKDYSMALRCLNLCYFMQYNNKNILINLVYLNIKENNIKKAAYNFYELIHDKEDLEDRDILLLNLFSKLTSIPEMYAKYINDSINIDNMLVQNYDEIIVDLLNIINENKNIKKLRKSK